MLISVINQTNGAISDADLLARSASSISRLQTTSFRTGACQRRRGWTRLDQPRANAVAAVRGDAILYVTSQTASDDPEGCRDRNFRGVPYGVVDSQMSEEPGDPWSVTLSDEAPELVAHPQANNYVIGPAPNDPLKKVFYWFEADDSEIDVAPSSRSAVPECLRP